MLRMDQVHVVRHKVLVEKKSARSVAAELGLSRNTVRKYLQQSEPRRVESEPRPRPVLEQVQPRIDALLDEWSGKSTAKQRVTAARVHKQLRAEGYAVGASLVRAYLREVRLRKAEVFIPLVHTPGDEAQVDFFEVVVDVGGQRRAVWMFVMRLMYSRRDFAWLYERCDQVSFLDGHVRAFAHFGAVPQRCIYDNLTAAVRRVLPKRELTQRFAALVSHYLFEPCFARVGVGHDKGGVEGRGRGIRLQVLTPLPQGEALGDISTELLAALDARVNPALFAADQEQMLPRNPVPFEVAQPISVTVRSSATVRVDGATYSVPSRWAGRTITVAVDVEEVRFTCGDEMRTRPRQRPGGRLIRYRDYLPELAKKPQAVRQVAGELLQELGEPYGELWRLLVDAHGPLDAARVLAKLLAVVDHHGEDTVGVALQALLRPPPVGKRDAAPVGPPLQVAVPAALAQYHVEAANVATYDALLWEAYHA